MVCVIIPSVLVIILIKLVGLGETLVARNFLLLSTAAGVRCAGWADGSQDALNVKTLKLDLISASHTSHIV